MKFSFSINRPKFLLDPNKMRAAIERGLDDSARAVADDLERPTREWKRSVKMQIKAIAEGRQISTDNEIYGYVAKGTRPHIIRAKNAKYLAFGSVYAPKTIVNSLESRSGGPGPADTFRKEVHHPGTEARNFDKEAAKNARKAYPARMRQAVKEGIK